MSVRRPALKQLPDDADSGRAIVAHVDLSIRHLLLAGLALALLVVLCTSPSLLGDRVSTAVAGLDDARPAWLWLAGLAFAGTSVFGACAWRAAIHAGGTTLRVPDAVARYCVGTGINALAPAHAGSAVRLALFGRVTGGGCWAVGGAAAAVGVTRVVWLGALIALGCAGGILPAWPLLAIGAVVGAAALMATATRHVMLPLRLQQCLASLQMLARSPRDLAIVAGWALAGAAAKVGATACVLVALGVDNPLRGALIVVPAVELAAVMPITPGNVGLASAAVAFALGAQGVPSDLALAAGVAFGAVELLAALAVGVAGTLGLTGPLLRPYVRLAVGAATYGAVVGAFGITVLVPAV